MKKYIWFVMLLGVVTGEVKASRSVSAANLLKAKKQCGSSDTCCACLSEHSYTETDYNTVCTPPCP